MDDLSYRYAASHFEEPRLATLSGFDIEGWPIVDDATPARSLVPLSQSLIGHDVVVTALPGNPSMRLILGVIQPPVRSSDDGVTVIDADRALVLRCGKSSLILERGGRIALRGKQVLSRADGQNRVQGATVSLN